MENKKTVSNQKDPSQRLEVKIKDPTTNENNNDDVVDADFEDLNKTDK